MALFAEAVHKLGLLIRVVLLIMLLVPMFWMMAYPLWIAFTPPWFDLLCMVAAGVSAMVMLVVGTVVKLTLCNGTPFLLSWKVTGVRQVKPQAVHSHPCKDRYTR